MKELEGILKLDKPSQLISKLRKASYAFACWRMPKTSKINFIISLEEPQKVSNLQLANLGSGFIVNEFANSHPVAPFFISADVFVEEDSLKLDPRITGTQLDNFVEKLKKSTNKSKALRQAGEMNGDFEKQVAKAIQEIKSGSFEKVVLSRYNDQPIPEDFAPWSFFEQITNKYDQAFCSMCFIPEKGLWIGATPELLISESKDQFKTVSLAGTKVLEENQKLSEIAWTQKEIEEQAFVSRYIINCFKKIRLREFHEHGPKTVQAGHLAHLKTEFVVDYKEVPSGGIADQMLSLLHPTSAVCGMPIEKAKPWLEKEEAYEREFYSGFLGPVNMSQETNLFVNLRCMKVSESSIRFYAGAGITEDSDPSKEYLETEMKMNVLRRQVQQ